MNKSTKGKNIMRYKKNFLEDYTKNESRAKPPVYRMQIHLK